MNRRELIGTLIGAGVLGEVAVGATLPTVEIEPCPMDLAFISIRQAMRQAGPVRNHFTYRLTVHPDEKWRAIEIIINMPDAHFELVADGTLRYVDEWFLRGTERIVHSNGA